MSEELLTTAEVAKRLGLTLRAVQKMIESERLEAKKIGRDYVIRADALDNITRASAAGRPPKAADATDSTKPKTTKKASSEKKSKTSRKAQSN